METKTLSDQQLRHKERRAELRELSNLAKLMMKGECEGMTVNEILIEKFHTDETNREFKTLWQWSAEGFKVNKGAVSFLVWGKPKSIQKGQETAQKEGTDEEEEEFFPLCYLFSNAQVTKR